MNHFEYLGIKIYLGNFKIKHWLFHENEFWKDIPGYEGLYQASTLGRIKSYPKTITDNCMGGERNRFYLSEILRQSKNMQKTRKDWKVNYYLILNLRKDRKTRVWKAHRVIALTFIPNPFNKKLVNHKNGKKFMNRKTNLEWNTDSENQQHAINMGLRHGIKRPIPSN